MSESQRSLDPELTAIEAALGSLTPARGRIDRDRLMFEAGRASTLGQRGRLGRLGWPALAASLAAVALGEAIALVGRPAPRVVERLVVVRETVPTPAAAPSIDPHRDLTPIEDTERLSREPFAEVSRGTESDYARLRRQVLQFGLDGLPPSTFAFPPIGDPTGKPVASVSTLLRSEIDALLNPGDTL